LTFSSELRTESRKSECGGGLQSQACDAFTNVVKESHTKPVSSWGTKMNSMYFNKMLSRSVGVSIYEARIPNSGRVPH